MRAKTVVLKKYCHLCAAVATGCGCSPQYPAGCCESGQGENLASTGAPDQGQKSRMEGPLRSVQDPEFVPAWALLNETMHSAVCRFVASP